MIVKSQDWWFKKKKIERKVESLVAWTANL